MSSTKQKIQEAIRFILREQDEDKKPKADKPAEEKPTAEKPAEEKPKKEKPKKKKRKAAAGSINIAAGATGRGRFTAFVGEAKARAQEDAKGLMKDLGVKSASGNTDLDRVKKVIQTAINFNAVMGEAYSGATGVTINREGQNIQGVKVFVGGIKRRDGIKFVSHTLTGAKNAGVLSLEGGIEIGVEGDAIFIQAI
tara:strand:- start:72 stop:659 length:588 start_codon:yes stop_codon:yes gene_type:complete